MQELLLFGVLTGVIALFIASFFTDKWLAPLLAGLLSIIGGYSSFAVQNTFCAEVIGSLDCITTTTYNFELILVFTATLLLSFVLVSLRVWFVGLGVEEENT